MSEGSPGAEDRPGSAGGGERRPERRRASAPERDHALAELVSRVVERGVVVTGELVVSVADVDLLYVGLDVLLSATDRLEGSDDRPGSEGRGDDPGDPAGPDRG